MTKYKKQHFIPQCYLSGWCDLKCPPKHTPYIWCFSKDGTLLKNKSPENIFYEKNMYTIHLEDGSRDLTLEHGLSQLETLFASVRKKKIDKQKSLNQNDCFILCLFAAAMQSRTKVFREHQRKQWKNVLDIMDDMKEEYEKASPQKKRNIEAYSSTSSCNQKQNSSLSYEGIRNIVENPTQTLLMPMIRITAPLLYKLNMCILLSNSETGFITSDDPCIWFDPQAYKRPPMYRAPALMYKTIEITLPISPNAILFLNRQKITGYIKVDQKVVDSINCRTRSYADEYFVVNSKFKHDSWFDPGTEPEDSWERIQEQKTKNSV